ncbi:MAG: ATP-binding protein [Spirochaetaceae bacterium]
MTHIHAVVRGTVRPYGRVFAVFLSLIVPQILYFVSLSAVQGSGLAAVMMEGGVLTVGIYLLGALVAAPVFTRRIRRAVRREDWQRAYRCSFRMPAYGAIVAAAMGAVVLLLAVVLEATTTVGATEFWPATVGILLGNVINLAVYTFFVLDYTVRRFRINIPVQEDEAWTPRAVPVITKVAAVVLATGILPFMFIVVLLLADMDADVFVTLPGIVYSVYVSISVLVAFAGSLRISSNLLLQAAERLEAGDYETHTQLIAGDEFTSVTRAFNRAFTALRDRDAKIHSLNQELRAVNRDLESTVQERTQELEAAKQRAEAVSERRRDLIHVLSHDLRNPLSAVHSLLELSESAQESLDACREDMSESISAALELIDNVRRLQALESGKMDLQVRNVALRDAVAAAYRLLEHRFREKGVELVNRVPAGCTVLADDATLRSTVLGNLLSNAVKFSYPGCRVVVDVHGDGPTVRLRVTDSGVGMPEELRSKVFSETAATRREGTGGEAGTGFGMPLVRRIVEAYGGEINVYSPARAAPGAATSSDARDAGRQPVGMEEGGEAVRTDQLVAAGAAHASSADVDHGRADTATQERARTKGPGTTVEVVFRSG